MKSDTIFTQEFLLSLHVVHFLFLCCLILTVGLILLEEAYFLEGGRQKNTNKKITISFNSITQGLTKLRCSSFQSSLMYIYC